jgi:hypothetical protein
VPVSFAFAWLNAFQAAVRHSTSLSDPCLCQVTQANRTLTAFKNFIEAFKRKELNGTTALSKFLVLLAIFLSASYANAFLSINQVAGDQVQVNYFI